MAKLHFYYSAMNAGKSTVLLQSSYNYQERGMDTLLFLPESVTSKTGANKITSRIGLASDAIAFDDHFNFMESVTLKHTELQNLRCVLIDEAQFLNKNHVHQLCQITDEINIPVLCYGLRTDFRGEPFEGSQYLLAWADQLIELKAICHCGKKATMNQRIDGYGTPIYEGEQVEIGGNERYVATCRKHFIHPVNSEIAEKEEIA